MAQTIEGFVGTSLDEARMSPIHWRVFALIAAGYFFDVCDYVILGSLIPDMVKSGFATAPQIATVASATNVCPIIGRRENVGITIDSIPVAGRKTM